MFVITLTYIKKITVVEKYLAEHIIYLEKYYSVNRFICSGRRDPRIGGVIIAKAKSRDEILAIIEEDPFNINGVANYEVVEFIPSKFLPGFEEIIAL